MRAFSPGFPDALVAQMFAHARHCLLTEMGLYAGDPVEVGDAPVEFQMVNVTLSYDGSLVASQGADAPTLAEAITAAMRRSVADKRFGGFMVAGQAHRIVIELLIQLGAETIDNQSLRAVERGLAFGVDGIELRLDGKRTYFKPGVPLTKRWADHQVMLRRLCKKAGLENDAWKQSGAVLRRTEWLHYAEGLLDHKGRRSRPVELYRNRLRQMPEVTRSELTRRLSACANRLANAQRFDGAFTYLYDPVTGEVSDEKFNMVRMCGCTYAMTRTAAFLEPGVERQRLIAAADRGLQYLLGRASEPVDRPSALFIAERKRGKRRAFGKLGSTALSLLALEFGPFRARYETERRRLVEGLLERQRDDGRWRTHHHSTEWPDAPREEKPISQNFFPGETLLALVNEWQHTRDPHVFAAIQRAFPVYRDHFRSGPTTAFVLWQVDAWRQLAELVLAARSDVVLEAEAREWVDFCFEVIDWVLAKQFTPQNAPFEDWLGGYYAPRPPRMATTVITEAVIRATGLAALVGDLERVHRYREAALWGLRFSARLQIDREEAFRMARPELAVGGITSSLTDLTIRNDNDQHAITMWIAALETPALDLPA